MSCNGSGRGRGWLNLTKNANVLKPGLQNTQEVPISNPVIRSSDDLISRIHKLSLNFDDGILLNQKVKYVLDYWPPTCSREEFLTSFNELYKASLQDRTLGSKLALFATVKYPKSKTDWNSYIRTGMLSNLQKDFDKRGELQASDQKLFENFVHLFGEYIFRSDLVRIKKRLCDALFLCLETLLESIVVSDFCVFTNQLFLNGTLLNAIFPDKMPDLCVKIKTLLIEENQLFKQAKLWLLLALELFNVNFGVLSTEVFNFYEAYLGDEMENFHNYQTLSINIDEVLHPYKELDKYCQIPKLHIASVNNKVPENSLIIKKSDSVNEAEKRTAGRPILGAGARFSSTT